MSDNPVAIATEDTRAIIEASRAAQEVQASVILAKKFPRDWAQVEMKIAQSCARKSLAECAVYSFPRGGTQVNGPSIRLAEALAAAWGNLQYGIVEVDRRGDESTMMAYAWDLESNVTARTEFKVRHVIDSRREGKKALTEERDIYEAVANQGSRRLRSCILKIIPGDVCEDAVKQCEATLGASIKDLPAKLQSMVETFGTIGVTKAQIEKRLRHHLDATNAAEVIALGRIYTSIKDGMSVAGDYFEIEAVEAPKATVPEAARAAASKAAGKKAEKAQEEIF
jgi:hypothetical protein